MAFTIMLWLVVILAKQAAGFLRKVRVVIHSEWDAGGSPAASHFLLLRQKKVTQEKATPGSSALTGCPALLASEGGCGTRARRGTAHTVSFRARPQTVLADYPFTRSVARLLSWGPLSYRDDRT